MPFSNNTHRETNKIPAQMRGDHSPSPGWRVCQPPPPGVGSAARWSSKRLHRPPFPDLSSAGGGDPRAAHRRATGGRYTGGGELARTTSSEGGTGAKDSYTTHNTDGSARARHAAVSSHRESSYNQDGKAACTAYDSYRTKRGRSGGEPVSLSAKETGSSRQSITPA